MARMAQPRDFPLNRDAGAMGRTHRIIGLTAARELNVETVVFKLEVYRRLSAQQAYGDMLDPLRDDDQRR
jgi:hypothetical protein